MLDLGREMAIMRGSVGFCVQRLARVYCIVFTHHILCDETSSSFSAS